MILIFLIYLGLHLGLYLGWFRRLAHFDGEAGILAYHAVPGLAMTCLAVADMVVEYSAESAAAALFLIALHGIYSLTFVALWALARGSSSAHILEALVEGRGDLSAQQLGELERVVARWRKERLDLLERWGLIHRQGRVMALTRLGAAAAWLLAAVRVDVAPRGER